SLLEDRSPATEPSLDDIGRQKRLRTEPVNASASPSDVPSCSRCHRGCPNRIGQPRADAALTSTSVQFGR
ncbi:unnamed protein product, partial [Ascophyllum nodosum]